jgi:hypothetical protein
VLVVYLLAFFNPVVRSLRCIEDVSQIPQINRHLEAESVCRSTLSDANKLFDPVYLEPLIADLRARLPNLRQIDGPLEHLLDQVISVDGSFFNLAADLAWAIRSGNQHSAGNSVCRLNTRFCHRTGVPAGVSLSGCDGVGEAAVAAKLVEPGHIYLFDSGLFSFEHIRALEKKQSNFLCSLASGVNFTAAEQRTLSEQDRAAGVASDRVGRLSGCDSRTPPDLLVREVLINYVDRDGKPRVLRLLTDLLDLPAHLIAEMYRHRWKIELFFRWLKVHANFEHLLSHNRQGITLSFHVAVIASMLMALQTQRELSKYGYNLLSMVASGTAQVQDVLPLLEHRERERQLERDRLARKRASKKQD